MEKERLEHQTRGLQKLGHESNRAAASHYRLWSTTEDRRVVGMNLAGEQAAARTRESMARDLRAEVERLKAHRTEYEPPPRHAT